MTPAALKTLLEAYSGYKDPHAVLCGLVQQLSLIESHATGTDPYRGAYYSKRAAVAYQRLCDDYLAMEFLDDDILAERYTLLISYQIGCCLRDSFVQECLN